MSALACMTCALVRSQQHNALSGEFAVKRRPGKCVNQRSLLWPCRAAGCPGGRWGNDHAGQRGVLSLRNSLSWKWLLATLPVCSHGSCWCLGKVCDVESQQHRKFGRISTISFWRQNTCSWLSTGIMLSVKVNPLSWFRVMKSAVLQWSEYTCRCSMQFGVISVQKAGMIVKPLLKFLEVLRAWETTLFFFLNTFFFF